MIYVSVYVCIWNIEMLYSPRYIDGFLFILKIFYNFLKFKE